MDTKCCGEFTEKKKKLTRDGMRFTVSFTFVRSGHQSPGKGRALPERGSVRMHTDGGGCGRNASQYYSIIQDFLYIFN